MEKRSVVIIGCGIAGMTAGIYLKRAGIDTLIISDNAPGGVLNNIPSIENYPGYEKISGPDLAMNIYNQVKSIDIPVLFKKIASIDMDKRIINDSILYEYLIIATGRKGNVLGLDNEKELIGKGVSLCALCDGFFYKDKEVIVVGGGNTALTDALYLSSLCKKVTIVHRRDSFTSFKYLIDRVSNTKNIDFLFNSTLTSYNIDDKKMLKSVCINDKEITTDGVFLAIGSTPNGELFDVNKENGYIIVDSKYNTSVNNVYAIGDVIKKDIYQLVTASYDAVEASYDIIRKESEKLDNYE